MPTGKPLKKNRNNRRIGPDGLPIIKIPELNLPTVLDIQDGVLDMRDMPDTAAAILSLRALGFSYGRVAKICKTSAGNVRDYCKRYDPQSLCKITDKDKRLITSQMLSSVSVAALMEITQEKLIESDAKDLSNIAARCANTAEQLLNMGQEKEEKQASRLDNMMSMLDMAQVEETE